MGLLLEEPPMADWDFQWGDSIVVADKLATSTSIGRGGFSETVTGPSLMIFRFEKCGIISIPKLFWSAGGPEIWSE